MKDIISLTEKGLYCAAGEFYVDPWRPVARAVITHGHADHARPGSQHYIAHHFSELIMRKRLGQDIAFTGLDYGEPVKFGEATVRLHSAGHILGSAQVRIEVGDEVWLITGDFKRDPDPTCAPFDVVKCDTLITEATFSMPVYRWPDTKDVARDIFTWWQQNKKEEKASILFAYSLGKCQRILAELMAWTDETVYLHGACVPLVDIYRHHNVAMLPTEPALIKDDIEKRDFTGKLIIAPPGASGSTWMRRFKHYSTGFCSGWMQIRGTRRRKGYDRGFILSDHADWPSLIRTIEQTEAKQVLATHGRTDIIVKYLNEKGIKAEALKTYFNDNDEDTTLNETSRELAPSDGSA